jgi:hypothetical protein
MSKLTPFTRCERCGKIAEYVANGKHPLCKSCYRIWLGED